MSFSERIRQIEVERTPNCGVCDKPFLPTDEIELHSITSLHLVYKDGRYVITDPPTGHEAVKGKTLPPHAYSPDEPKESDGVCLHVTCHQEIHRIALIQARLDDPEFNSNTPPVKLLEEVTLFFMNRKKPIVYESEKPEVIFIEKPKVIFF